MKLESYSAAMDLFRSREEELDCSDASSTSTTSAISQRRSVSQNVVIEAQYAEGEYARLPVLAAELVHRPAVIIVASGLPSVFAAKAATSTIPIVFTSAGDPVQLGIVASLNRPGGNITGVSFLAVEVASKRLELLLEVVPTATIIGLLTNPNNPRTDLEIGQLQAAVRTVGKQILVVKAGAERDFDVAFETLVQGRASALLIPTEPLFLLWRDQLVALAARHALPAIYDAREFTAAGGLLSYGLSLTDLYRLVAGQVARILKGAKPADLPILQPTKLELVINLFQQFSNSIVGASGYGQIGKALGTA
jgi:putative ABC transport system substrate-binding protein